VTYLVDANVLSEPTRPDPDPSVVDWLTKHETDLAIDPIILGEIRFGIHMLPAGKRRRRLELWFEGGIEHLYCIPWDSATGLRWASLLAHLRSSGKAMSVKDSMIAATALVHGLSIVTRNEQDFKNAGLKIINPFT
jgi:toxin FitB